jgi:thiol-disulfide isomerase/thioredoxin
MKHFATCLTTALLALLLSSAALAQGVESDPTGVDDMEPGAGEARRGPPAWLGIMMEEADERVRVHTVVHGSPADKAGLQRGDVIRSIGEARIERADDVMDQVDAKAPEDTIEITVKRDGDVLELEATLAATPELGRVLDTHFTGRPAPALAWKRVAEPDTTEKLDDIDGPVVVEFWATWCAPCKPMREYLGGLAKEFAGDVTFVAVSAEPLDTLVRAGASENARGKAYIPLGKIGEPALSTWIIETYPTVFVIDDGTVAGAFIGLNSREAIGQLVRRLADED